MAPEPFHHSDHPYHPIKRGKMSKRASGSIDGKTGMTPVIKQHMWGIAWGATLGGLFGYQTDPLWENPAIEWGLIGTLLGFLCVQLLHLLSTLKERTLVAGILSALFAVLFLQAWHTLFASPMDSLPSIRNLLWLFGFLLWPLAAWMLGHKLNAFLTGSEWHAENSSTSSAVSQTDPPQLLDSSAIIDGRVLPLCKTGFLRGRLLVPKCILRELQFLADSQNPDKRIRGKRGLDILSQLRTLSHITVTVPDHEPENHLSVDQQLLNLANLLKGTIITNDWNLAQIAALQGLTILNINELTYELRPLILPGQTIRVFIQKEGQGPGQGAAHLDDGTLVVIDHGSHLIGQSVDVQVSRYMQTNTGRMVFASVLEAQLASNSS